MHIHVLYYPLVVDVHDKPMATRKLRTYLECYD